MILCFSFVFKQKTAYEMRSSDWSSDVCSSDLLVDGAARADAGQHVLQQPALAGMSVHFISRDQRHPRPHREIADLREAERIVAAVEMLRGEVGATGKVRRQPVEESGECPTLAKGEAVPSPLVGQGNRRWTIHCHSGR